MTRTHARHVGIALVLGISACTPGVNTGSPAQPEAPPAMNTLSRQEQRDGWKLLFDGKSLLPNWRGYKADTISDRWTIVDGIIIKTRPSDDIVTREMYENFELAFDWKLATGGNGGAFFRATEAESKIYWSAPEFQLLDDAVHPDGKNPLTSAGAAYGLYAPPPGVAKGAGNWNSARIVARGAHIEHWMNGVKTIEYEAWSPEWKAKVAASKFKAYPNFGLARRGLIGFQGDHGGELQLKNIKIRVLK